MIPLEPNATDEQRAAARALCAAARRALLQSPDGRLVLQHLMRVFKPAEGDPANQPDAYLWTRNGHRQVMHYISHNLLDDLTLEGTAGGPPIDANATPVADVHVGEAPPEP